MFKPDPCPKRCPAATIIVPAATVMCATTMTALPCARLCGPGDPAEFRVAMSYYIGFNVVQTLFGVGRQICFSIVGKRIGYTARNTLFIAIQRQDIAFFDGMTTGQVCPRPSSLHQQRHHHHHHQRRTVVQNSCAEKLCRTVVQNGCAQ